jgi:hypothetical protein
MFDAPGSVAHLHRKGTSRPQQTAAAFAPLHQIHWKPPRARNPATRPVRVDGQCGQQQDHALYRTGAHPAVGEHMDRGLEQHFVDAGDGAEVAVIWNGGCASNSLG